MSIDLYRFKPIKVYLYGYQTFFTSLPQRKNSLHIVNPTLRANCFFCLIPDMLQHPICRGHFVKVGPSQVLFVFLEYAFKEFFARDIQGRGIFRGHSGTYGFFATPSQH